LALALRDGCHLVVYYLPEALLRRHYFLLLLVWPCCRTKVVAKSIRGADLVESAVLHSPVAPSCVLTCSSPTHLFRRAVPYGAAIRIYCAASTIQSFPGRYDPTAAWTKNCESIPISIIFLLAATTHIFRAACAKWFPSLTLV
jgi:hypothetical protein